MTTSIDNTNRLGEFLTAYEYLDGTRAYEDLPAAIYGDLPTGWDQIARGPSSRPIHDLVCAGTITAHQGALLLELRRLLAWRRRRWWDRLITRLLGDGPW